MDRRLQPSFSQADDLGIITADQVVDDGQFIQERINIYRKHSDTIKGCGFGFLGGLASTVSREIFQVGFTRNLDRA